MKLFRLIPFLLVGCTVNVPPIGCLGSDCSPPDASEAAADASSSAQPVPTTADTSTADTSAPDTSSSVASSDPLDAGADASDGFVTDASTLTSEPASAPVEASVTSEPETSSSAGTHGSDLAPVTSETSGTSETTAPETTEAPVEPLSFGSDWWPAKAADTASQTHTPAGTAIAGFRVEHITPYGGWFTFTSPSTPVWGDDYGVCWSTSPTELDTLSGMSAAVTAGRCQYATNFAAQGLPVRPYVVTSLEPATTYFARAVYAPTWPDRHAEDYASQVVEFTTSDDPMVTLSAQHPRVLASTAQLDELRARYQAGDSRLLYWVELASPRTLNAANSAVDVYWRRGFTPSAALLWQVTGDTAYRDGAMWLLMNHLLPAYEIPLSGNQYRWEGSDLATAADLLYSELDAATKQRIVDAMLANDEFTDNMFPRFEDTDQMVAFAWVQLSHALTFVGDSEIDPDSNARLEALLEHAVRRWYGVFQVKMRRCTEVFGLCDGTMDDGVDYARGTQGYWLSTMWMLQNNGFDQSQYSEWVWNNFRTQNIYSLLPDRSGVVTYGDVEDDGLLANGGQEMEKGNWSAGALSLCLLNEFDRLPEYGYARDALLKVWAPDGNDAGGHHLSLLCDDDTVPAQNFETLPLAYHAQGYGLVHDRTSWGSNASAITIVAGWRAVDHHHDDVGHFSLWTNGAFVTHELPRYEEAAANHNVLLLGDATQDYLWQRMSTSRFTDVSRTDASLFARIDMTSAYSRQYNGGYSRVLHDEVTRSLYWDKLTNRVVVYDRIVGDQGLPRSQNFVGSTPVLQLFDGSSDGRAEILSVVNGGGTLVLDADSMGVQSLVEFDRGTGLIQ